MLDNLPWVIGPCSGGQFLNHIHLAGILLLQVPHLQVPRRVECIWPTSLLAPDSTSSAPCFYCNSPCPPGVPSMSVEGKYSAREIQL